MKSMYASHSTVLTPKWTFWRYCSEAEMKTNGNVCNDEVFSCESKPEFILRLAVMGLKLGKCYSKSGLIGGPQCKILKLNEKKESKK